MQQTLEKTNPKVYHIHLDTQTPSLELHERIQQELGFFPHHFSGHPEGYQHFEPTSHSSVICSTQPDFERIWEACAAIVRAVPDVKGYMEGEFIPTDDAIPFSEGRVFFKPHFKIKRRTLSKQRGEEFRETEFHLVMDWDGSNQRMINALLDAGLYGALLEKKGWRAIVLTIQGDGRFIRPLMKEIKWYLGQVGGAARCTMKEEVAQKNERFNMEVEELPEIIDEITYMKTW